MTAVASPARIGEHGPEPVACALRTTGVYVDIGLVQVKLRSTCPSFSKPFRQVYRNFPWRTEAAWADFSLKMAPSSGWRRWTRPQAHLHCEGREPFSPFPADTSLPLFEWGCNWLIGQRMNHVLLLHSGVVERDGCALILPATPGSGKSTLTAALTLSGWRLLSDEFGALDPATGQFTAVLKPVALKNAFIEVIRRFSPGAHLGPAFPKTRKGTVAHLAPPTRSVDRVAEAARPGMMVFPRWRPGAATQIEPLPQGFAFSAAAFNSFNYSVLGAKGFSAAVALVKACPAYQLVYSDLADALPRLEELWSRHVQRGVDASQARAERPPVAIRPAEKLTWA